MPQHAKKGPDGKHLTSSVSIDADLFYCSNLINGATSGLLLRFLCKFSRPTMYPLTDVNFQQNTGALWDPRRNAEGRSADRHVHECNPAQPTSLQGQGSCKLKRIAEYKLMFVGAVTVDGVGHWKWHRHSLHVRCQGWSQTSVWGKLLP